MSLITAERPAPRLAHINRAPFGAAEKWLLMLCIVLLGYAVDGRGFAYIGIRPLYIGELTLLIGTCVLLSTRNWYGILWQPQTLMLVPFVGWGLCRTIPYLHRYHAFALRDAVVYGYSAFAVIVGGLLVARPGRLYLLINWYKKFWKILLICVPPVCFLFHFLGPHIPHWPGHGAPIIDEKEGDLLVHLGAIFAFWMLGWEANITWPWVALMAVDVAITAPITRGGFVAFSMAAMVAIVVRPQRRTVGRLLLLAVFVLALLWASHVSIKVPGGKGRRLSFHQLVTNMESVTGNHRNHKLEATKRWRLAWWHKIVDYTFFGKYFWTGKGYGINLADSDGFQVLKNHALRSPHSVHMTMLARSGVPGLAIWISLQLTYVASILAAGYKSWRNGDAWWFNLFMWILAYWAASMTNASFDVYLEGPMGGIWFWTVFGVGLGSLYLYRHQPDLLSRTGDVAA